MAEADAKQTTDADKTEGTATDQEQVVKGQEAESASNQDLPHRETVTRVEKGDKSPSSPDANFDPVEHGKATARVNAANEVNNQ